MTTKELDGCIPLHFTNGLEEFEELWRPYWHMANHKEQVYFAVSDCILEPAFFHSLLNWLNDRIVLISLEIINESKRYYPNAQFLGRKLLEAWCKRDLFSSPWVDDVQV